MTDIEIDGDRLLARLGEMADTARHEGRSAGVTRLAWSPEDIRARALLAEWADGTGLTVTVDTVGNVVAERAGTDAGLAPIVFGSHLDTVVDGGTLDGAYGTVAAFDIVAGLAARGERLRHPVRAVAWVNEEGVVAPPFTGSRVVSGHPVDLGAIGADGRTLGERLCDAGGDPDGLADAAWPPIAAYLELHIEQGRVLHDAGIPIGVVTAISGCRRGTVSVAGRADHAGATPMHLRRDALVAAAPFVGTIAALASDGLVDVATVGSLVVEPGNGNVVPGRVTLTYDLRSTDDAACDDALGLLRIEATAVAARTGTTVAVNLTSSSAAVATAEGVRSTIAEAARGLRLTCTELPSGAGHDAQYLATLGPMGMIFVPSVDGISHNPAESTSPALLVAGARTLLDAVRLLDTRTDL
ncbi:MAG: Zn-dependent hydrolase [Actinomycetota bacterium]|nr:Zn-dependent hydrolase [Actinomycetota bacterium]